MFGKPSPFRGKTPSEENKRKTSERSKGNKYAVGHHYTMSDEEKKHLGEVNRGTHFYNNGSLCVRAHECPEGWVPGKLSRKNRK